MTYDAAAKALGIKAIGTVESSFDYTAINYNDPITVGVMQWYGTRAATLLRRMRDGGSPIVTGTRTNLCKDPLCNTVGYWRVTGERALTGGSAYIQVASTAAAPITLQVDPNESFPVTSGATVSISFEVRANFVTNVAGWILGADGATTDVPIGPGVAQAASGSFVRVTHTVNVAGNGTVRALARTVDSTGVATGSYIRIRNVIITVSQPALPFFSGSTASTATKVYAWTGAVNNSTSTESTVQAGTSSWTGVAASINAALDAHPNTDGWWDDRFLTREEGESLRPMLSANKAIQNLTAIEDMEVYKRSAVSLGIDPEGNTNMMLLFFVALHQSPARARRLIATIGPSSSFDRLLSALLNEEVFRKYPTRYNTAARIILSGDSSGVDTGVPPVETPPPGGDVGSTPDDNTGATPAPGEMHGVRKIGDNLHIATEKGLVRALALPNGEWHITGDPTQGVPVPPPTPEPAPEVPVPPTTPPGGAGDDVRVALAKFMTDRVNQYAYSQGGTRMEPDKNGYTDCSGMVRYAYQKVTGVEVGTYTVEQLGKGTRILEGSGTVDESKLKIGDLVLYNWRGGRNSVDHVEMYIGNGQVCGHGGPGKGPTVKTLQGPAGNALNWYVNRYV